MLKSPAKMRSSENGNLVFGIHTAMGGRLSVVGGGLPVIVEGEFVGGIRCSSDTPQQDMECSQAGVGYLLESMAH